MNAEEAKKITQENLKGPVIEAYMEAIHSKIKVAAENGKSSITHPFDGARMPWPSFEEKEAVWACLRAEGYEVTHNPDPDPGHPASSPYDSISWE